MILAMRELAQRRRLLVARSAAQRLEIAGALAPFTGRLSAVDRTIAAVRAHPVIAVVAAGVLALIGPRVLLRWAARLIPVYSLLRRL